MLDFDRLDRAIDIHSRSYRLLLWADSRELLDDHPPGRRSSDGSPDDLMDWFRRNSRLLPDGVRPDPDQIPDFARYFETWVSTSFDYDAGPPRRHVPNELDERYAVLAWLRSMRRLKPKKPTGGDRRRARTLVIERVEELACEERLVVPYERCVDIADHSETRHAAAYSAYGSGMIRRLDGETDGPAQLVLWRAISRNEQGGAIPGFALRRADFEQAEHALIDALRDVLPTSPSQ